MDCASTINERKRINTPEKYLICGRPGMRWMGFVSEIPGPESDKDRLTRSSPHHREPYPLIGNMNPGAL